MSIYEIEPLRDARWDELVLTHPMSSAFHTRAWLSALSKAYGYDVRALTTTPPATPLSSGIVFCRVKSWLTGTRVVSLPFSDHCQPLADNPLELGEMVGYLCNSVKSSRAKYCELRPLEMPSSPEMGIGESAAFWLHMLDLRPSAEQLFQGFHKNHIQRKIKRAEREELVIRCGNSEVLLQAFHKLLLQTRRRHLLPPQPLSWYRALIAGFGDALQIRVAFKSEQPVASILTLRHKKKMAYKYGCSDSAHHNLGAMPLLFWRTMLEARESGVEEFDFGRTDLDNEGLTSFKDNFGGARSRLTYWRYPVPSIAKEQTKSGFGFVRRAFSLLPDFCLTTAGKLLYKHIG